MSSHIPMVSPTRRLALRFISGKYQGSEVPIGDPQEIIVGRASDLDMVLVEDMVSRRHARIACNAQQITIEDLGSTNGTFVNGEKIKRALLKEGDRVLIGTSILKVVAADSTLQPRRRHAESSTASRTQSRSMSGAIDEIPLPDLLQLLGTSKKTGVLVVRTGDDVGKIYLNHGVISHAIINDLQDVSPEKSVYRILSWTRGTFDFESPEEHPLSATLSSTVQELLMEGLRQIDELNAIRHQLPDLSTQLTIPHPLVPPLRDLSPLELDVLQAAYNHLYVSAVFNKSPATDLDTAKAIVRLIEAGYVIAE
jgi:hypothetical protein